MGARQITSEHLNHQKLKSKVKISETKSCQQQYELAGKNDDFGLMRNLWRATVMSSFVEVEKSVVIENWH